MSPETSAKKEIPKISENSYRELAKSLEELIKSLEDRKIPLSGRICTGIATRNKQEKDLTVRGEKNGDVRTITISVTEVLKDRPLDWLADLTLVVPVSNGRAFWRKDQQEKRNWFDPDSQVFIKTPRGTIKLNFRDTPQIFPARATDLMKEEPFSENTNPAEVFELAIKTAKYIKSIVENLDGQRQIVKDLSGRTLIVD